jgi:putative acetyltransferase
MPRSSTTPTFNFHAFVPGHMAELTDLWVVAWAKAMPSIDFEARRGWFVDHLIALRDQGTRVWCAFDASNGVMAGFVTLDPATGLIDQLAVSPQMWGQGAAVALLAVVRGQAVRPLLLDVNADNPRAIRFYEREGFRCMGEGVNPNSGLATRRYALEA